MTTPRRRAAAPAGPGVRGSGREPDRPPERAAYGVLVLAHGSPDPGWTHRLEDCIAAARLGRPTAVGYLDHVPGRTPASGVRRLEAQGVAGIVAVPLFVATASTHVVELRHAVGAGPAPPFTSELERAVPLVPLHFTDALDDAPVVRELVYRRTRSLVERPPEERLVLVGHGSDTPGHHSRWQRLLRQVAREVRDRLGLAGASIATVLPPTIADVTAGVAARQTALVVPFFLAPGYYTRRHIPAQLPRGERVRYSGETFLPDPGVARWLRQTVAGAARLLAEQEVAAASAGPAEHEAAGGGHPGRAAEVAPR